MRIDINIVFTSSITVRLCLHVIKHLDFTLLVNCCFLRNFLTLVAPNFCEHTSLQLQTPLPTRILSSFPVQPCIFRHMELFGVFLRRVKAAEFLWLHFSLMRLQVVSIITIVLEIQRLICRDN